MSPLFSVIVPVYQVARYLDQCVQSVVSQTLRDLELILVDDGSTDGSATLCDSWVERDSRVRVIHKSNGGSSSARNAGLEIASGEYTVFLDSDDYIGTASFLETIAPLALKERDLILYGFRKYYESDERLAPASVALPEIDVDYEGIGDALRELVARDAFYAAAWAKAVRTELLRDGDFYFRNGILSEDQEWYYHVLLAARSMASVRESPIVYRQRAGSITSTTGTRNLSDTLSILEYWSERISGIDAADSRRAPLLSSLAKLYCNLMILYAGMEHDARRSYHRRMQGLEHLLKHRLNPRTRWISRFRRLVGFDGTILLLGIALKLRRT